ncbi:MAG: hypothetical protein LW817_07240 [Candidatus Caenarcaniphilales bacterium]|jgi:hypothetical protein|nr:hypothetical protein [Candidatus Caenarcaniphilales bacterium]
MNTRNFSVFLAGLIWALVGIRIISRGLPWLEPYFSQPDWHLSLLLVSLIIAGGKAFSVLKKAAARNLGNLEKISDKPINYLIGWLILYNVKGCVFIALMMGLGIGLRHLREFHHADPYNLFGFLYLGIGLALVIGSSFYFKALQK